MTAADRASRRANSGPPNESSSNPRRLWPRSRPFFPMCSLVLPRMSETSASCLVSGHASRRALLEATLAQHARTTPSGSIEAPAAPPAARGTRCGSSRRLAHRPPRTNHIECVQRPSESLSGVAPRLPPAQGSKRGQSAPVEARPPIADSRSAGGDDPERRQTISGGHPG